MSFDGSCFSPHCINPFLSFDIGADDLRCLSDAEIFALVKEKTRRYLDLYEKGSEERKQIINEFRRFISKNCRLFYAKHLMREILKTSNECLDHGLDVNNVTLSVIDIFKRQYFSTFLDPDEYCKNNMTSEYQISQNGKFSISKKNEKKDIDDRKIIGCVHYGTRPYSLLEKAVKDRSMIIEEDYFFNKFRKRCRQVKRTYDQSKSRSIPAEAFPFGIDHYIFGDLQEHSILLSVDVDGNITPEGKIEGIFIGDK